MTNNKNIPIFYSENWGAPKRRRSTWTRQNTTTCDLINSLPKSSGWLIFALTISLKLYRQTMGNKSYRGTYTVFRIPCLFCVELTSIGKKQFRMSFPRRPVSSKFIKIVCQSTAQGSEQSGKWATVFLPYCEPHDKSHYNIFFKNNNHLKK